MSKKAAGKKKAPRMAKKASPFPGLLLGAGASFDAGFPLANAFTTRFRDNAGGMLALLEEVKTATEGKQGRFEAVLRMFADSPSQALHRAADRVGALLQAANNVTAGPLILKEVREVLADPRFSYEDILGHLETQADRERSKSDKAYPQLYSALVAVVCQLFYEIQTADVAAMDARLPGYSGLLRLAEPDRPLWIFSLNHDLIVEAIADGSGLPLFTGFRETGATLPIREEDGSTVHRVRFHVRTKEDLEKKGLHYCNRNEPGINLLKLHGSLDEFAFNDGDDLLKLVPNEPGLSRRVDCLRLVNERIHQPFRAMNEISYVDDDGVVQFLRRSILASAYKYDGKNRHVLPQKLIDHFRMLVG